MEVVLKFETTEFMLEYAIIMRHVVRMIAEQEDPGNGQVQRWKNLSELVYNAIEAALEHDPNKELNWVKDHELHGRLLENPIFQSLDAFNSGRVIEEVVDSIGS